MELSQILEKMKDPSNLTPAQIFEFYMWTASMLAQMCAEESDAKVVVIRMTAAGVGEGLPANQAEALAMASDAGVTITKLKGRIKGMSEVIRVLKKAQQYYSDESQNKY